MASGLGSILRDREYVTPRCVECAAVDTCNAMTKPAAIRRARRHAAESGHSVILYIAHYQVVRPVKADRG